METKGLSYYKLAQPILKKIGEWFFLEFGFRIDMTKALSFCITSINIIPEAALYLVDGEAKRYGRLGLPLETVSADIPKHVHDKLRRTYDKYEATVAPNKPIFITALIMYRWHTIHVLSSSQEHINLLHDTQRGDSANSYRPNLKRVVQSELAKRPN